MEKQDRLKNNHVRFSLNEFEKLDQFIESLNYHNLSTIDEGYLEANVYVISRPNCTIRPRFDLCVYKLQDDWYIVSFKIGMIQAYSVNFLCDQLDAVHTLLKLSISEEGIRIF